MSNDTSMIERVARALCVADGHDPDATHDIYVPGDPVAGHGWAGYRQMARAAIEAMRDPTVTMKLATGDGPNTSARVYTAMIDAALAEMPAPEDGGARGK